jgi:signal transduction histidine kinase
MSLTHTSVSSTSVVGVAQDVTDDRRHANELRSMQYLQASQEAKVETERNMTGTAVLCYTHRTFGIFRKHSPFLFRSLNFFISAYFAHELRNPLHAIDSALISMPDELSESARYLVNAMKLCTGFMASIMNNLLDVRKMEEGKMILKSMPISLKELMQSVHKMLMPSVRSGVEFINASITDGPEWAVGDSHRMQQVLTNVVTNA